MKRVHVVVAVLAMTLLGGCKVEHAYDNGQIDKIGESGHVDYDLTRPRTAVELGMPADMTSGIIERHHGGNTYLKIHFTLPGGTVFTNDRAFGVGVAAPLTDLGDNSIVVNTSELTLDAIAARLRSAQTVLGIPRDEVDIYLTDTRNRPEQDPTQVVFIGKKFGYLSTDVEVLPSSSGVITMNYDFTWDTGPTPDPSTGATPS